MSEPLERTALAEPTEPGEHLTARPQRLGILPSYWFWDREGAPFVRMPMAILAGVLVFTLSLSGLPWYVVVVLPSLLLVLSLGLFERYIRRQVEFSTPRPRLKFSTRGSPLKRRGALPESTEHESSL